MTVFLQLVDDVLDFTSGANQLGKPSAADLKLGLATGPVLFACQQVRLVPTPVRPDRSAVFLKKPQKPLPSQFPELHAMIMRRFSSKGDVDRAWQYVLQVRPAEDGAGCLGHRLHLGCLLLQSDGVEQTNYLAQRYCQEAIRHISLLRPSAERDALIRLTEMVLTRDK